MENVASVVNGREISSCTPIAQHNLVVFLDGVLQKTSGPQRVDVTDG
jgi:hypothetical protein